MSPILYGRITRARDTKPGTHSPRAMTSSGLDPYIELLAALVPAEVLALHAVVMSFAAQADGNLTTIDPQLIGTLRGCFAFFLFLCVVMYVLGRGGVRDRYDVVRAAISPLAFVAWTMLQRTTFFDALPQTMTSAQRTIFAVILAATLAVVVKYLPVHAKPQAADPVIAA
jgi:hypothetical protein